MHQSTDSFVISSSSLTVCIYRLISFQLTSDGLCRALHCLVDRSCTQRPTYYHSTPESRHKALGDAVMMMVSQENMSPTIKYVWHKTKHKTNVSKLRWRQQVSKHLRKTKKITRVYKNMFSSLRRIIIVYSSLIIGLKMF